VDLDFLRRHPRTVPLLIEHQRIRTTPLPTRGTCVLERLTLDDGTHVLAKSHPAPPAGFFAAEAAGLQWLSEPRAVRVPEPVAVTERVLVLTWVEAGPSDPPGPGPAEELGRGLAALHRAGAPAFGAGWPGFVGTAAVPTTPREDWPTSEEHRLAAVLRLARDQAALDAADAAAVERVLARLAALAGPPEPPARLHGDLRRSTVLWTRSGQPWLVGPSAVGGHRESDLAALGVDLDGGQHLDRVLAAYQEVWPLAEGWRERVPLHSLYPLLARAARLGGPWGARAGDAARRLL